MGNLQRLGWEGIVDKEIVQPIVDDIKAMLTVIGILRGRIVEYIEFLEEQLEEEYKE